MTIVQFHDRKKYPSYLTQILHEETVSGLVDDCHSPDHKEWAVAAHFDESKYEDIKYWISKGAQVKDLNIRKMLLDNQRDLPDCEDFLLRTSE